MTEIQAAMETITPETAKKMLSNNDNNRKISHHMVDLYAREMQNGEWSANGEAIKFSESGRLLDGQHRLMAVISSGIPLYTLVIRGLKDETQQTMDSGKKRSVGDALNLQGERNSNQLAAIARIVYVTDQLGLEAAMRNQIPPTPGEIIDFVHKTPQLQDLLSAARVFQRDSGGMMTISMFAALWWAFAHLDTSAANSFFSSLATGAELSADSPILLLRNQLQSARLHGQNRSMRNGRIQVAALTIKAWNSWRRGKSIKMLKFSVNETFPEPC